MRGVVDVPRPQQRGRASIGWLGHDTNYKFINDGETSVQTKCCCMMNCALIEINCVCQRMEREGVGVAMAN